MVTKGIPLEVRKLSKVTVKYQVTIPVKVRKQMGIIPGTEVDIKKEGQKYVLVVNPVETIKKKWRGRFRGGPATMDYIDEIRGKVN